MRTLLSLVLITTLVGCGGARFVSSAISDPILLPVPQSSAALRAAIIRALQVRRYSTESEQPGSIQARIERRGELLRIAVEYAETGYTIHYVTSEGIATSVDEASGEVLIDDRWLSYQRALHRSIDDELARPVREAAEREAQEREYQLMLAQQERSRAEAEALARAEPVVVQPSAPPPQPTFIPIPVPLPLPQGEINLQGGGAVSQQSYTCCINGSFYACPGRDAWQQCTRTGPSQCQRDGSRDRECD